MAPLDPYGSPLGVFTKTFADMVNDSRYDGTFTTVYRGNWSTADRTGNRINANGNESERTNLYSLRSFQDMDKIDHAGEGLKSNPRYCCLVVPTGY